MSNWHEDQRVVCIVDARWGRFNRLDFFDYFRLLFTGRHPPGRGPVLNEVCTVDGVFEDGGCVYLALWEWRGNSYEARCFRPLTDLEEQLERIEEDPVEEPEPQHA